MEFADDKTIFSSLLDVTTSRWQSLVLTVSLAVGCYFTLRRNPQLNFHLGKFPGPKLYPVVGLAHEFIRPSKEYIPLLNKWVQQYGTVIRGWLGPNIGFTFISDPNIIEKVLSTTNHLNKSSEYDLLHKWLGTGLLTARRNKWTARRKLLTPAFHFKILEDFIPIFNEQTSIFLNCLKTEASSKKSFNIYSYIARCTLDVICETAMGKKINAQTSSENKKYIDAVDGISSIVLAKLVKPWLRFPLFYYFSEKAYLKILQDFSNKVIHERKMERMQRKVSELDDDDASTGPLYGTKRKAFLDLLLDTSENGAVFTDDDIREEVDTFMFEGHDTTATNLSWAVLLLALNMECQKKLQDELDTVFADNISRDVTVADISKMKYLECCIKEALRLYPSVPFIMREIDSDIPLDKDKLIPKDSTVMISIYHAHRNPQYFPEPELFKPERFLLENARKLHPYSYIPFSAGPRNCIGQKFANMKMKVLLAKLFRMYRIEVDPNKESFAVPDVVLRPQNGVNVFVHERL